MRAEGEGVCMLWQREAGGLVLQPVLASNRALAQVGWARVAIVLIAVWALSCTGLPQRFSIGAGHAGWRHHRAPGISPDQLCLGFGVKDGRF